MSPLDSSELAELLSEAEIVALRSNLALSPAQRVANLVAMNIFHARMQERTVPRPVLDALRAREVEEARRRIEELEHEHST